MFDYPFPQFRNDRKSHYHYGCLIITDISACSLVILPLYGHRVLAVTCQLTQTRAGYGVSVRPEGFS